MDKSKAFVLWYDEISIEDVPFVGGKNASNGEMFSKLTKKGVNIPNGFAITAYAYHYLLEKNNAKERIKEILKGLNTRDIENLQERGRKVRELIRGLPFPRELEEDIVSNYRKLCQIYGENTDVAVRSSATAEDLPEASFAGQQETYLNVRGEAELLEACKKCFASLFTDRAISYREDKQFDHFSIGLSIGVQKMVRSDLACSGVMFSVDTESEFDKVVFITAIWGLGENIVQGAVNPDEYYVFKPTLKEGFKPIISKSLGSKEMKMIYDLQGGKRTKNVKTEPGERDRFCLTDDEILQFAKWAVTIEEHYSEKAGHYKPMDMEWAKDGKTGQLFIVQARPETIYGKKKKNVYETYILKKKGNVLITGKSVGEKIGKGKVRVIKDVQGISQFKAGEVLVTEMTDPDWEPIMKIASAIVTNRGGRTCHAAIISRELGIPCVVGTENGTTVLKDGQSVTVDCSQGDIGYVYEGSLDYELKQIDLSTIPKTKTKIMMILGNPDEAFDFQSLPNSGVGLAREEFIITSYIKVHPLACIDYPNLPPDIKQQVEEVTKGYIDKKSFFIEKLANGIAIIAAAFYPKPVILRFSDFKTNEYANLLGGKLYEPTEDNPMIGWRGASRYYDKKYERGFALECEAVKRVRDVYGLKNLEVMIPFCRTLEEGKNVLATMKKYGLERGKNGLKVNVMCEIPSNVILAEKFLDMFDGFSIGTNDLTQLTLGVDRDSEIVAHVYDERNEAVKSLVRHVISVANKKGKYIGLCGQAPSDYPEFAEFLVRAGIQSIALNPDVIIKTILNIAKLEKSLGKF